MNEVLIVGASVRAAAFSALRAELQPSGADLFGDADLLNRCPSVRLSAQEYPANLVCWLQSAPHGPWLYTGALENRPAVVQRLARLRMLWGNSGPVLRRCRDPFALEKCLRGQGLPCPRCLVNGSSPLQHGRWLVKPLHGAGGRDIRLLSADPSASANANMYLQEFIEGDPCAAVYIGDGNGAALLGVTRQLIGEPWLNAPAFHYCGSVGPLSMNAVTRTAFERLGKVLVDSFHLRGLFGVDCVLQDEVPYPVEVNPRYTASVEVLEYATGIAALALHRDAFEGRPLPSAGLQEEQALPKPSSRFVAKAILFAREPVVFPDSGPWLGALDAGVSVHELPAFADIPHAGERIGPRQPILTCLVRADSVDGCVDQLRQTAQDLDRWLTHR